MSWLDKKSLEEKRAKLVEESGKITEMEAPSAEDKERFDAIVKEVKDIDADIARCNATPAAIEFAGKDTTQIDLPKETRRQYSLLRAIRLVATKKPLDGLEKEVNDELARQYGKEAQGFYTPFLTNNFDATIGALGLDATTGTGGIANILDTNNFIDVLRNKMVTAQWGARTITGVKGNYSISKKTSTSSAYWVAEGVAPTESNLVLGDVDFTPKTVGASTPISRKFMIQTNFDSEMLVRDDLSSIIAIELDRVGLAGDGTGAEPTGVLYTNNVNTVSFQDTTNGGYGLWPYVVEMETEVATDNADIGNLGYVTTPAVRGYWKSTDKAYDGTNAVAGANWIWAPDNSVNGYKAFATNQLPNNLTAGTDTTACSAVIFGNAADLVYVFWTGLDVIIDPYTSRAGSVQMTVLQDCDVQLRRPESFCVVTNAKTT